MQEINGMRGRNEEREENMLVWRERRRWRGQEICVCIDLYEEEEIQDKERISNEEYEGIKDNCNYRGKEAEDDMIGVAKTDSQLLQEKGGGGDAEQDMRSKRHQNEQRYTLKIETPLHRHHS